MSETNEQRTGPIIEAAIAYEAAKTVATRDALFAAVVAARTPRFYAVRDKVWLYRNGRELPVADCTSPAVADAMVVRLNTDLDNGWVPQL